MSEATKLRFECYGVRYGKTTNDEYDNEDGRPRPDDLARFPEVVYRRYSISPQIQWELVVEAEDRHAAVRVFRELAGGKPDTVDGEDLRFCEGCGVDLFPDEVSYDHPDEAIVLCRGCHEGASDHAEANPCS